MKEEVKFEEGKWYECGSCSFDDISEDIVSEEIITPLSPGCFFEPKVHPSEMRWEEKVLLTDDAYEFSINVSAGSKTWVKLYDLTTGNSCYFDISNGVVGSVMGLLCKSEITGLHMRYGSLKKWRKVSMFFHGSPVFHTLGLQFVNGDLDDTSPDEEEPEIYGSICGHQLVQSFAAGIPSVHPQCCCTLDPAYPVGEDYKTVTVLDEHKEGLLLKAGDVWGVGVQGVKWTSQDYGLHKTVVLDKIKEEHKWLHDCNDEVLMYWAEKNHDFPEFARTIMMERMAVQRQKDQEEKHVRLYGPKNHYSK